jgi:hypothetical protein
MSQRDSGYDRKPDDFYETPAWVTNALQPYLVGVRMIWDPAAGRGAMVKAMSTWPAVKVRATDLRGGIDFLTVGATNSLPLDAIVCNPPYSMAQAFIDQALQLTRPWCGRVAMLLRVDFDSAKTRRHLFGGCAEFSKKLVLTSRIRWFAGTTGSPSFNHAWFVWDWANMGRPATIRYHYEEEAHD